MGLVGLANGLRELVRGGGGGGIRLLLFTFDNKSALRSGTGGLPAVGLGGCGGLVSVSEPLGYECNRLKPCV